MTEIIKCGCNSYHCLRAGQCGSRFPSDINNDSRYFGFVGALLDINELCIEAACYIDKHLLPNGGVLTGMETSRYSVEAKSDNGAVFTVVRGKIELTTPTKEV